MGLNRVTVTNDRVPIKNVLISVWDKTGLDELIETLENGPEPVQVYSTGGTYSYLSGLLPERSQAGPGESRLISVDNYTGRTEVQGGLVKTLDWKIYLGLLAESENPQHQEDLRKASAVAFDMVVVNLYPFKRAVSAEDADIETGRSFIDIGGPCMLRAAAKNFLRVAAVCNTTRYSDLCEELRKTGGSLGFKTRYSLAQEVFETVSAYDAAIAGYLGSRGTTEASGFYRIQGV